MIEASLHIVEAWKGLGIVGLGVLGLAFALGALVFAPRPLMCIVSGLVFGFAAVPVALVATTVGAALAFLAARHLFRRRFLRMIETRPRFKAVVRAIDEEGWRLVGLLRLGSPIPSSAQSYLFGLTRIGLWPFAAATFVGIAPQVLFYVQLGAAGQMAIDDASRSAGQVAFTLAGLAVMALAIALVSRRAKAALAASRAG